MASKLSTVLKRRPLPKVVVGIVSALFGLVVLVSGLYGLYAFSYRGLIFPNTMVAGLAVGGLSQTAAEQMLLSQIRVFEGSTLSVAIDGEPVTITPDQLDVSYNAAASAARAYARGRGQTIWRNMIDQVMATIQPIFLDPVVTYNASALNQLLDQLGTRFNDPAHNASLEYVRGKLSVIPERSGQEFDRSSLNELLVTAIQTATVPNQASDFPLRLAVPSLTSEQVSQLVPSIQAVATHEIRLVFEERSFTVTPDQLVSWVTITPVSESGGVDGFYEKSSSARFDINREQVAGYVKTVAAQLAQEPIDAKLTITNGRATVFAPSRDGRTLDEAKTVIALVDALVTRRTTSAEGGTVTDVTIQLPVTVTKPSVTSSTIDTLGIKDLIGTATTDFSGSPSNRVHNIGNGVKFLNGWLVKPGDEFSTVKALGTIDGSTGYLPELVIKENRTIPEFGGGLCQVSTTLFRSVLNAGLPVTERRNHSYRVSYYERGIGPGLDATVYLPKPDFKFQNDTPGWILVQGSTKGNTITFELYGTKDGREVAIDGPHTLDTTPAPPTVYEQSDQLAPSEQKEVEHAHAGATTVATYTVRRNGEVINQQIFQSKYKALPARIMEGPKADLPASDSATEASPAELAPPAEQ
ncbi:VanW family protein [Candidatus Berkelbacteria bacterium]|nr:VanW family protein [Candidatus Berkelbacteria bacterium]